MARTRPGPRTARLHLEHLEDRSVPSTLTVNTTLDDVTPANGKFSLREAITKANTTAGADVIVVPVGVFKITIAGASEDANATGDFDITDAVTIQGAGAGVSIIDGQQLDRVFDVIGTGPHSIKPVLQGLTVRGGNATGDGGAIQVANADLVVRDSAITGNRASLTGGGIAGLVGSPVVKVARTVVACNVVEFDGGGVHAITATLTNCTVRRNVVTQGIGGGVLASTATLTNCTVSGNSAGTGGGGIRATTLNLTNSNVNGNFVGRDTFSVGGGGIWADAATLTNSILAGNSVDTSVCNGGGIFATTATLTNCTVSGNSARSGGGIWAFSTATLTNCTVSGNSAGGAGGIGATTATLTRCTVSGNSAGGGGGGIGATTAKLTNCTVSGNSAGISGGGIFADTATLLNSTVADNLATTGGGLFHNNGGGAFTMKNTLVALNLVRFAGAGPDLSGSFTSLGHNLIGAGTGATGFTNGVNGDLVGTSTNPIDPKLGPLANNGGPTKTHALLAGSPAIDHGDNAGVPATDQRGAGFPRKKDGNGDGAATVDIGAFEK
jgi:CSLREA domain-containing protein